MIEKMEPEKATGTVVVRFPPSPTGLLHIGNLRTFLFNYLFAKKQGGKIILRFEDTDRERSKKEYEENIMDAITWLGLTYEDGPYRQSERSSVYRSYLEKMLENGSAYISQEVQEDGEGDSDASLKPKRAEVIRLKNKNKKITFHDMVRGDITFDTTELGDIVIAKSLDEAIYHFAVVVDDHEMSVTHVIRGEDHISNTPRQILIQEAIGAERPSYVHIPLILASDRSKLSKRHGAVAVTEYRAMGYLPEALANYLALLGWNPGTDEEIFSLSELVERFDFAGIQKAGAIFKEEKLRWINKQHLMRLPQEVRITELERRFQKHYGAQTKSRISFSQLEPVVIERISVWNDFDVLLAAGEFDWCIKEPVYEAALLHWKGTQETSDTTQELMHVRDALKEIPDNAFSAVSVRDALWDYASEKGRGAVLWPLRVALSGKEKSPDPFTLAGLLGKEITVQRIAAALNVLE